MIPEDLLSAFPHRQFHTLPGLLDSWAALPNSYPNACMPMQGGSLYHFYDGLWYDPAERRTHDLLCERRTQYRLSQPDTVQVNQPLSISSRTTSRMIGHTLIFLQKMQHSRDINYVQKLVSIKKKTSVNQDIWKIIGQCFQSGTIAYDLMIRCLKAMLKPKTNKLKNFTKLPKIPWKRGSTPIYTNLVGSTQGTFTKKLKKIHASI